MSPVYEAKYFFLYHCGFLFAGWWGIKFQAQKDQVYTQKQILKNATPKNEFPENKTFLEMLVEKWSCCESFSDVFQKDFM